MKSTLLGFLLLFLASCTKELDLFPKTSLSKQNIFESEQGLELYSRSFYNILPTADEIMRSQNDEISDYLARKNVPDLLTPGAFGAQQSSGWDWTDLRNINSFIGNLKGSSLNDEIKNNYLGIARFFRALFYFKKVVRFGDVPWVSEPLEVDDSKLYGARDSRFIVMDSVLKDLNYSIKNIKLTTDDSKTLITKNVAFALKSRICLFEASFRKYHIEFNEMASADEWYNEVVSASDSVIKSKQFSLNLGPNAYRELFINKRPNANEIILADVFDTNLGLLHVANWNWTSATYGVRGSFTKQFINTYLNIDGSRFTDDPEYKELTFFEETQNRDLRLAQTIRTPGYERISGGKIIPSPPLFSYTYTGYQPIKWVLDDMYYDGNQLNDNALPIFRYAEILLNLAEAKAELGNLDESIWIETIGALRKRAGILDISYPTVVDSYLENNYYPDISDPVLLEIRRERGIELALEGFRFRDLIRWKEGGGTAMRWDGMYVPSLDTYLDLNGDGISDVYFYKGELSIEPIGGVSYVQVGDKNGNNPMILEFNDHGSIIWGNGFPREWKDKMYFYPIPESDRLINPDLGQNPGW